MRVLIDLAKREGGQNVPLKEIAERQGISKKYLESIAKDLVGAHLLIGASGKGGGYRLAKNAQKISVGEILEVTEGSLAVVACLETGAQKCPRAKSCETLPLWNEYNKLVHDFFYSKKLSDLL